MRNLLFLLLVLVASCSSLPYQDDTGFLVSAQANSPEFPVYVNGSICKDMDGTTGLCSKRINSTQDLVFHLDPMPYAYDLTVVCTNPLAVAPSTVPANTPFDVTIKNSQFIGMKYFICVGEVFPQDRTQPLSAKWDARIIVFDSSYEPREGITLLKDHGRDYIVLGRYARDAWVFDGKSWKQHHKDTMVDVTGMTRVKAYSESYMMRFNYLNMDTPVQVQD